MLAARSSNDPNPMSRASPVSAVNRSRSASSSASEEPAPGMPDDHDLVRSEKLLADDQRADHVLGREPAGVADDVRFPGPEPEGGLDVEPRVHARDDGQTPQRGGRQCRAVERLGVAVVLGQQPVELAPIGHARVRPAAGCRRRSGRSVRRWSADRSAGRAVRARSATSGAAAATAGLEIAEAEAAKRSMPGMARRSVASFVAASSTVVSVVMSALAGRAPPAGRAGPAAVSVRAPGTGAASVVARIARSAAAMAASAAAAVSIDGGLAADGGSAGDEAAGAAAVVPAGRAPQASARSGAPCPPVPRDPHPTPGGSCRPTVRRRHSPRTAAAPPLDPPDPPIATRAPGRAPGLTRRGSVLPTALLTRAGMSIPVRPLTVALASVTVRVTVLTTSEAPSLESTVSVSMFEAVRRPPGRSRAASP